MSLKYILFMVLYTLCLSSVCAGAGVQAPYPEKSRVIITQGESVVTTGSLAVTNPGESPWLLQAWLEDENGVREGHVYPELSRLEPNFSRRLLIAPALSQWSAVREGLNWLVIRLIPSSERDGRSRLTIPLVFRIKVFLRSRSVEAEQEKPDLFCDIHPGGRLMLHNRGRHYVTLTILQDRSGRMAEEIPLMVAPDSVQSAGSGMNAGIYKYGYVDDRGMVDYGRVMCR